MSDGTVGAHRQPAPLGIRPWVPREERKEEVALKSLASALCAAALALAMTASALADGYYICTSGSACGQFCRYSGPDNAENRKKCKKAGCTIGGTRSSEPGANIKVCSAALGAGGAQQASIDDIIGSLPAPPRGAASAD